MHDDKDLRLALTHGRSLLIERSRADEERIQIRSASGEIELAVVLTAEGAKARLRALDLELDAARAINVRCETFSLETEQDAGLPAGHGIALDANDDVDVKGERVLLNVETEPMARTWEDFEVRGGHHRASKVSSG